MGYLKIKNKKSGATFETTREEYDTVIASKGLSYKYEIIDDGSPLEVKNLREKLKEKKEAESTTVVNEVVLKEKKEKKPKEEKNTNG